MPKQLRQLKKSSVGEKREKCAAWKFCSKYTRFFRSINVVSLPTRSFPNVDAFFHAVNMLVGVLLFIYIISTYFNLWKFPFMLAKYNIFSQNIVLIFFSPIFLKK